MNATRTARSALILFGLYALLAFPAYGGEPDVAWVERSRALADQLMSELQAELGQAMQQGGPVAAVAVCKSRAPEIAARFSASSGADVGRTAIRLRNPANAPDDLERAIVMQPVCLACHGATIAPELVAVIAREYPQDTATGFEPGELRGAVTVRWPATR